MKRQGIQMMCGAGYPITDLQVGLKRLQLIRFPGRELNIILFSSEFPGYCNSHIGSGTKYQYSRHN